jgi:hypothetical protein
VDDVTIELGKLEQVDPRTLWDTEPGDFTPWLAKNIELLAEELGLDLELLQVEKPVGDFSCDILARDTGRDRPVIIENQLEATDHRHLGQLLTYASGLDAAVVVWISPEIREEHRQALDWLNRHTDEGVDFFGVALEVVRIDDSKPAVHFKLAAAPNAWTKKIVATGAGEVTERQIQYQDFFQAVIDELREKHQFTNAQVAQPTNWYAFSSGTRGLTWNGSFASRDRLRAEFYIDVRDTEKNKAIFDKLFSKKAEIELKTGPLDWERLDQKRASRISLVRHDTNIEDAA